MTKAKNEVFSGLQHENCYLVRRGGWTIGKEIKKYIFLFLLFFGGGGGGGLFLVGRDE